MTPPPSDMPSAHRNAARMTGRNSAGPALTRRGFLGTASVLAAVAAVGSLDETAAATTPVAPAPPVDLHWLDGPPAASVGAAWGVPWPRGQVDRGSSFALTAADGTAVPVQSWPLAFWPDGSLKWSGHAVAADARHESFRLTPGKASAQPASPVAVTHRGGVIEMTNGTLTVQVATSGTSVLPSIVRGQRATATNTQLVLDVQDAPDDTSSALKHYLGTVDSAEVEQRGPVRAVVKLTGTFRPQGGGAAILPWTLRVYLAAGDESIRLVHTFLWDADPATTYVRGLGLRCAVPMSDALHDRHVRFGADDGGVWGEPVRVITGLRRDPGAAVRKAQVDGSATPPVSQWSAQVQAGYQQLAVWNDYTLFQDSPRHFAVWKRTSEAGSWLKHAGRGGRASGFGYVGGVSGGLGVGLRDFWQRFPRGIDVRDAGSDSATVTLWSWAPQGGAMDLRHYDTVGHGLDLAYEDVQQGFSTPQGIARSTEMQLWAFAATPPRDTVAALSTTLEAPPQLVAAPATYHSASVFGRWSLPDRSTAARSRREDAIAADVAFYREQVDEREWYGFWNYGDVMHTYDADRHEWRYDVGGYAWDNGELGTDAMLWYAFLRSGDPATFRMARALTQHVSEVDTHHIGRFAGLGSRHNVVNWGDGAKEARVGESYTKRFAYYLTADDALGDLIRYSLQADDTLTRIDPLREVLPPQTVAPARVRIGPDWYALVSNWLTEWERTGEDRWRDRILTGMQDIATFPAGLFTGEAGGAVGFDPKTGHLVSFGKGDFDGGYNLAMAFLGEQILWETLDLVDAPAFRQTLLDFCHYVQATSAEKKARYGRDFNPQVFKTIYSRMTAWAGEQTGDAALRSRGWQQLLTDPAGAPWPAAVVTGTRDLPEPTHEIPAASVATNDAAQRNLAYIALLDIAPQEAP